MDKIKNLNRGIKAAFGLVVMLCLLLALFPEAVSAADGDTWDPDNGSYVISTAADLNAFRSSITSTNTYKGVIVTLANDIEVGGTVWGSSPTNGKFEGIFNGQGHAINGFDYALSGLFYNLYGQIINLDMSFNVTANRSYGGLANKMYDGATVINCSLCGTLESSKSIAGIAVSNTGSVIIKNCYSSASITSTGGAACGLMSSVRTGASIENCYAIGIMNGSTGNFPIANIYSGAECTISDCYYLDSISATAVEGVTVKSESDLKDQAAYPSTWDFTDVWQMDATTGYPILRQTLAADQAVADPVTAKIEALPQASEITLDDVEAVTEARSVYDALTETQKGYVSDSSLAVLEAAEAAINSLKADSTFDPTSNNYVISTAYDLNAFRSSISATNTYKGVTVTLGNDIDISTAPSQTWKTLASAAFEGVFDGKGYTIKGYNDGTNRALIYQVGEIGQILNLNVEYNLASGSTMGGIAYYVDGTLNSCSVSGTINSTSHLGGLAYYVNVTGNVKNCSCNANITATGKEGAGIAQRIYGTVENCYTTSAVSAVTVKGIGDLYDSGIATNCFYIDTIAVTSSTSEAGLAKSEVELKKQETYTDWDFKNIWQIETDSYPTLRQTVAAAEEKTEIQVKALVTIADKTVPATDVNTDYSEFLKADYQISLVAADGTEASQAVIDSCNAQLVLKNPDSGIKNPLLFTGIEGDCDFTNALNGLLNQYELTYTADGTHTLNFFSDEDRIGVYGEDYSANKPKLIFNDNTSYSQDQKDAAIAATETRIQESLAHYLPADVSGHDAVFGDANNQYGSWLVFTAARAGYTPHEGFNDECYQAFVEKYTSSGKVNGEGNPLNEGFDANEVAKDALAVTAIGYDARDVGGYNLIDMLTNGKNPSDGYFAKQASSFAIDSYDYLPGTQKAYAIELANKALQATGTGTDPLIDMYIMGSQPLAAYYDPSAQEGDELYPVKRAMEEIFIPYFARMQGYTGVFYSGINYNNPWSNAQIYIMLGMGNVDIFQETFINNGYSMLDNLAAVSQSYSADQGQIARGYEAVVRACKGENQIFDCTDVLNSTVRVNNALAQLPEADAITSFTKADAQAKLDAVDEILKANFTQAQLDTLDMTKYDAVKAKLASGDIPDVDEATQAVIDAITALPAADTITLDNEAAVTAARSAYKALSDDQKKLVNADLVAKLEAAEAAVDGLKPDTGTVTIDVERFTIGQGFFKEPVTMAYTKGDTVMDVLKKLVGEDNIVGSSSNVSGIKGADLGTATIPDYITNDLKGPSTDEANEAGCKDTDVLAAGDYDTLSGYVTGWMYLVNDEIPNITANDYVVQDGDVIRWAFTVWGYGADLDGVGMGGFGLEPIEIASRDVLLKALAALNSADNHEALIANEGVKTAYDNALLVAADMTKTTDQTQAAADTLTQAVLAANGGSAADQQAADAVTALIAKLPKTVTLENATAVAEARTAYDALTGDQQKLVTNLSILTAAEAKIAELNSAANQAAADTVKAKITALPATDKLTLVDKSTVTAARAAYTALTADQQKLVTNLSTLTAAEAKITALEQAVIDQEKADAVTASITALPATTAMSLSDQAKVEAARTAYNALSDVQKKLVTNLSTLTAAETKIAELVKAQTKTITIDVERFTIGQGFYVEPVTLSITDGMTARQAIEKQLGADNLVGEVGYLRAVVGADTGSVAIPDYIVDTLGGGDTDTAMAYGQKYTGNTLGEFDYSHDSGWMYLVNNETPNVGMNAYTLEDGDVLRLAFTYCGYGEDLTGLEYGSNKVLVSIANKDNLLKQIAVVNGDKTAYLEDEAVKTAYNTAMTVVSNMTATQKATNDAASALATAIAAFVPDDDDQTLADAVTAKIAALPAVDALKLANKSSVTAARAAYNSLTETQKALVTNLSTLVAAEAKIKALEADAPVAIDKATGIEMIGFDEGVDLLVGDLSDDKDVQAAALKAAEEKGLTNSAILALYNIKPDLSVKDLEAFNSDPDATAVLTIPIPEDQQGFDSYLIYHLKENGEVEWLTPVVSEDGKSLSVTVSQFSTFAIVVEDDAPAPDPDVPTISYQTHVQNVGWQREKTNGALSGTEGQGLRLEGIRINVGTDDLGVSYQTQIENIGWQETKYDGDLSGTEGQGLRLEGIRINLTGDDADQYDIYYRVHAQNFGWMDWAKNGQDAGTEGFGDRLEAIEIKLVKKDGAAPGETACPFATNNISVSYQTQIQNVGWQGTRSCGALSGTEGQGLRLEGIKINLETSGYDVGVTYQTQIENVGWQAEVSDGDLSGTVGQSLRLEGIKINLTGEDADLCDIYYQVHAQNVGWMGWAKNGEAAGTEGFGYRLEGIHIVVVPKGQAAPGSTANAFTSSH
ncbi:MAG: hypothetical protein PWP30_616 [Eubacteriaceae bacterium]|nr:hypothetical protein [Eubacteriaceae bacterium]